MINLEKKPTLVIGYGNSLRSDDGIGQIVAIAINTASQSELSEMKLKELTAIATHQLTPELAEKIIQFEQIIFIDAEVNSDRIKIKEIEVNRLNSKNNWTHHINAEFLIHLVNYLYQKTPKTWLITIPIKNIELGEEISKEVKKEADKVIKYIVNTFTE